ncbi:MAG: TIGR02757 family protein [Treponema sp.]|nr:TIGR02757 family protein [Candidatus Treponema equifaecale]
MTSELIQKIQRLALEFETSDFLLKDPSQFMHVYSKISDVEAAAFISANLAFGRRDQILSHVKMILDAAGPDLTEWILNEGYRSFFPKNQKSFYRMYTNSDMLLFFEGLKDIFTACSTAGEFFEKKWKEECQNEGEFVYLHKVIAGHFSTDCKLLPHSKGSSAKKVNMLLRWLVRDNSPVDLGLWKWYDKKNLLMPLDTHVMQQGNELGLIKSKSATLKTAIELTKKMSEIFPDDPVKGDFALFGLGVSLQ